MKKIYTTAMLSAAVLAGAAFGPSIAGAQTADESTDTTTETTEDTTRQGRGGHGNKGAAVAEILGLTQDEVRTALSEGQTVADLAEAQGIEIQSVIDAIIADMTEHIDEHVADGHLTAEEAAEKLVSAEERVTERVNTVRVPGERMEERKAALAEQLGMTVEELEAAKADGTSIRDLAEDAGIELEGRGGRGGHRGHGADASEGVDA